MAVRDIDCEDGRGMEVVVMVDFDINGVEHNGCATTVLVSSVCHEVLAWNIYCNVIDTHYIYSVVYTMHFS